MISIDQVITASEQASAGTVTTGNITTSQANNLFVVCVGWELVSTQTSSVSGLGLTWTKQIEKTGSFGGVAIHTAPAYSTISAQAITATVTGSTADIGLSASILSGVDLNSPIGASNSVAISSGVFTLTITSTRANSLIFAVGSDNSTNSTITPGTNQVLLQTFNDSFNSCTVWSQRQIAYTAKVGTVVTMNDTAPATDSGFFAALEILPAMPSFKPNNMRPRVFAPGIAR